MGRDKELKFGERSGRQLWEVLGTWDDGAGRMRKGGRTTLKIDHLSYFAIWTFFIILFLKLLCILTTTKYIHVVQRSNGTK